MLPHLFLSTQEIGKLRHMTHKQHKNSSVLSMLPWRSWIRWGNMDGGQGVFADSQVLPRARGWCWERNNLSSAPRRWGCPELASQPVPQSPPVMFGLLQRFAVCWGNNQGKLFDGKCYLSTKIQLLLMVLSPGRCPRAGEPPLLCACAC